MEQQPPSSSSNASHTQAGVTPWTLWAKWSRTPQGQDSYHPLLCHLIDVAQCADTMWSLALADGWKRHMSDLLGLSVEDTRLWLNFWAGLHDLGKACPGFQLQLRDPAVQSLLVARLTAAGLPADPAPWIGHGEVSAQALRFILRDTFGMRRNDALEIALAVGGHHGRFPAASEMTRLSTASVGQAPWAAVRLRYAQWLAEAVGVPATPPVSVSHAVAMAVAGFVSVVDWIGSCETYFHHGAPDARVVPTLDIPTYVATSRQRAAEAFAALGWTGWNPSRTPTTFAALFDGKSPRPLQDAIIQLAPTLTPPAIVVIEAPMGEGKTEAAMYLADYWTTHAGQRGIYFALPSQASSNQMFDRVSDFLEHRYPADVVNAQLLHGHAALSATLRELRARGRALLTPTDVYSDEGDLVSEHAVQQDPDDGPVDEPTEGAVIAAEWFSGGKRALLAPFGVGTVDQALLAALQTLHVFVRMYGLSTKTVIVDEVHAYDTYMMTLLRRLMEWLGALHTPVILLSATLPRSRRQMLIAAYGRGAGWGDQAQQSVTGTGRLAQEQRVNAPYPRITWAHRASSGEHPVASAKERHQTVSVEWVAADTTAIYRHEQTPYSTPAADLVVRLRDLLSEGGCAAIICNTVSRAQRVYRALKPHFAGTASDGAPELNLLHARFPLEERSAREQRSLARFGPPSAGASRPFRAILVATQIIEQSLDLDFDVMVSELAPGDLVLQRMGRMHRHDRERPPALRTPRLLLMAGAPEQGVPSFAPGSVHVYDPHILLRSWLALRRYETLSIPDDIEPIVEYIYESAECPADATSELRAYWDETWAAQQKALAEDEQQAQHRYIGPPWLSDVLSTVAPLLRDEDSPELHPAFQALTRLTEVNVTVACFCGGELHPQLRVGGPAINLHKTPSLADTEAFLQRSLTISDRRVVHQLLAIEVPSSWQKLSLLRRVRPLFFDDGGNAQIGLWRLRIDDDEGVRIERVDVS